MVSVGGTGRPEFLNGELKSLLSSHSPSFHSHRKTLNQAREFCYQIAPLSTELSTKRWITWFSEGLCIPCNPLRRAGFEPGLTWICLFRGRRKWAQRDPCSGLSKPATGANRKQELGCATTVYDENKGLLGFVLQKRLAPLPQINVERRRHVFASALPLQTL